MSLEFSQTKSDIELVSSNEELKEDETQIMKLEHKGIEKKQVTPLPKRQLFELCLAQFGSAVIITLVFPFAPFMILDFGMTTDEREIGFYAGFIGTSLFLGRFLSSFIWGYLSDKYGRKIVLVISLAGICVFTILFGLSKSFVVAVIMRFIAGVFNGVVGTIKTMIADITDSSNQAKGMSAIGTIWGLALIFGPALGGILSQPCDKYPDFFSCNSIFGEYPFLLPCLVASAFSFIGLIASITTKETYESRSKFPNIFSRQFWKRQTKEEKEQRKEMDEIENLDLLSNSSSKSLPTFPTTNDDSGDATSKEEDENSNELPAKDLEENKTKPSPKQPSFLDSTKQLFRDKLVVLVILLYTCISFVSILFDEVFSLWVVTSPANGGLGWKSDQLGIALAITGAFLLLFQFFIYPKINNRFGIIRTFQIGSWFFIPSVLIVPFIHYLHDANSAVLWIILVSTSVIRSSSGMVCFTASFLLINNSTTSSLRGSANGLAMAIGSLAKGLGPETSSSLYSWSLINGIGFWPFNHHFTFVLTSIFTLVGIVVSMLLPKSVNEPKKE